MMLSNYLKISIRLNIFILHLFLFNASLPAQNVSFCATENLSQLKSSVLKLQQENKTEADISQMVFWQRRVLERIDNGDVVLRIPVVVHVIHNDLASSPNPFQSSHISTNQVISQIKVINDDFRREKSTNGFNNDPLGADVGIEFCLASTNPSGLPTTGINYVYNSRKLWNAGSKDEKELKSLSYWPSDKYLNIWVTNLEVEYGFGYARYPYGSGLEDLDAVDYGPELDGVVIDYRVFGTVGAIVKPYNLGRTTTHEIGHWLGLKHLWGDLPNDFCGDDFVEDTPVDEGPNDDLDCADSSACSGTYNQDMTNNYMDFSPDVCMNIFTIGQKARMLKSLLTSPRRTALFESTGCSNYIGDLYANIYPNPVSEKLNVELYWPGHQSVKCMLMNSFGVIMMEKEVIAEKALIFSLNVTFWPAGIYYLKTINNASGHQNSKKIVSVLIQH